MERDAKQTVSSLGQDINGTVFYPTPEAVQRHNNRPSYEQVVQHNSELLQANGVLTGQVLFKDQHIGALERGVKSLQELLATQHAQAMSLSSMNTALMLSNKKLADDISQQSQIVSQQKRRNEKLQKHLEKKTDAANQLEISGYLTSQAYEARLALHQELMTLTEDECRHDEHVLRQQGKKIHALTQQVSTQQTTLQTQAQQLLIEQQQTATLQVEIAQLKARLCVVLPPQNSVKNDSPASSKVTAVTGEHSGVMAKEKSRRHRARNHPAKTTVTAPPVVTHSSSLESQAPNNKSSLPQEAALTQIMKTKHVNSKR